MNARFVSRQAGKIQLIFRRCTDTHEPPAAMPAHGYLQKHFGTQPRAWFVWAPRARTAYSGRDCPQPLKRKLLLRRGAPSVFPPAPGAPRCARLSCGDVRAAHASLPAAHLAASSLLPNSLSKPLPGPGAAPHPSYLPYRPLPAARTARGSRRHFHLTQSRVTTNAAFN